MSEQALIDWCIECSVKHGQTGKVFMREALQRAEAEGAHSERVKERVRGVIEELSGLEADTNTVKNDDVRKLNKTTRKLRKYIYKTQAEIGGADMDTLKEIKMMVDMLVDQIYKTREKLEECPTCVLPEYEMSEEQIETFAEEEYETLKEDQKPDYTKYGAKIAEKRRKFLEEVQSEVPPG